MSTKTFTTTQVCKIVGVSRPAFQVWMEKKYLTPSIWVPSGPGDSAKWSYLDLVVAKTFQKLIKAGMARETAAFCAKYIQPQWKFSTIPPDVQAIWFQFYFNEPDKIAMRIVRDPALKKEVPVSEYNDFSLMIGVNMVQVENEVKEAIASL